jgi:sRNA-binding carbon storage regulator CsrA
MDLYKQIVTKSMAIIRYEIYQSIQKYWSAAEKNSMMAANDEEPIDEEIIL